MGLKHTDGEECLYVVDGELKSDQNGIETPVMRAGPSKPKPVKIRPKWD